ncbi:MAG: hypothetical protein ACLRSW_17260 [Christensenellaceae bacterium]
MNDLNDVDTKIGEALRLNGCSYTGELYSTVTVGCDIPWRWKIGLVGVDFVVEEGRHPLSGTKTMQNRINRHGCI